MTQLEKHIKQLIFTSVNELLDYLFINTYFYYKILLQNSYYKKSLLQNCFQIDITRFNRRRDFIIPIFNLALRACSLSQFPAF